MKYLNREVRDEVADVLIREHDSFVRYCNLQAPHPSKGINIKRGIAENKIKRLRELIALLAPKKLLTPCLPLS